MTVQESSKHLVGAISHQTGTILIMSDSVTPLHLLFYVMILGMKCFLSCFPKRSSAMFSTSGTKGLKDHLGFLWSSVQRFLQGRSVPSSCQLAS
jgi:hypothetical protein